MVDPADVPRILLDAARLIGEGEVVVFGSAALAFRLDAPPRTRNVDVWCDPPEKGHAVDAVMGELSRYHDRHGAYCEVWGPETFAAPSDWRRRARHFEDDRVPRVRLVVPHPHDVMLAKVERWEESDREHARLVLAAFPLSAVALAALEATTPYRDGRITDEGRIAALRFHLDDLRRMVERGSRSEEQV